MKILCPTCGARYSIADEKVVAGSRIRCRGCGGRIELASNAVIPEVASRDPAGAGAPEDAVEQASEASALFSLAALTDLAQASATVPETATESVAGDDSSLIDLRQLMESSASPSRRNEAVSQQSGGAPMGAAAPLGMVPLGVSPLGTPLPVETTPVGPIAASGSPPTGRWIALTLVAVAAAVATTVVSLRSGPPEALTSLPSATVSPGAARERAPAARPLSQPEPARTSPESESGSPSAEPSAKPSPPLGRRPRTRARPPRQIERRPPSTPKPPAQTTSPARGPCSHCKRNDLMCNMECAAKR